MNERRSAAMRVHAAVLQRSGGPRPYAQSRPLEITAVMLDPPGPGEVLIAIRAAGLCHSDLSVIDGVRPRPLPMVRGHEAAGVVTALGDGVRFHILNPGPTRTERLVGYAEMLAKKSAISVDEAEQQLVKDAPQRRIAEPAEMAGLIAWMLSDRFAAATGNSVTADGGWVKAAS